MANEEDIYDDIDTILSYCSFAGVNNKISIAQEDGSESFEGIMSLSEKDVSSLAKGIAERTVANGKIVFGLRRTNLLRAPAHWAQDFPRISTERLHLTALELCLTSKQPSRWQNKERRKSDRAWSCFNWNWPRENLFSWMITRPISLWQLTVG
jgi:hypothetical protein